jgi:chromosome segregation ATPase
LTARERARLGVLKGKAAQAEGRVAEIEQELQKAREALRQRQAAHQAPENPWVEAQRRIRSLKLDQESAREIAEASRRQGSVKEAEEWEAEADQIGKQIRAIRAKEVKLEAPGEQEIKELKEEVSRLERELAGGRRFVFGVKEKKIELEFRDLGRRRLETRRALEEKRPQLRDLEEQILKADAEAARVNEEMNRAIDKAPPDPKARVEVANKYLRPYQDALLRPDALRVHRDSLVKEIRALEDEERQLAGQIKAKRAELEAEAAASVGITRERYELLRDKTPSKKIRDMFRGAKHDAIYGIPI